MVPDAKTTINKGMECTFENTAVRFLLDEDLLPLLNDLRPHLVHNGFSTVLSLINSKRLVAQSNQSVSIKKLARECLALVKTYHR